MMWITLSASGINTPIKRQTATFKDPTVLWQESHMTSKDEQNVLAGQRRLRDTNCNEKTAGVAISDTGDLLPGMQTQRTEEGINSPKNRPLNTGSKTSYTHKERNRQMHSYNWWLQHFLINKQKK